MNPRIRPLTGWTSGAPALKGRTAQLHRQNPGKPGMARPYRGWLMKSSAFIFTVCRFLVTEMPRIVWILAYKMGVYLHEPALCSVLLLVRSSSKQALHRALRWTHGGAAAFQHAQQCPLEYPLLSMEVRLLAMSPSSPAL